MRLLIRFFNVLQVLFSFWLSTWLGKSISWGLPISMSIEPTTACNLKCPHCVSGLRAFTRPTGTLCFDLYKKIIEENKNSLIYLTLYFQGEPLIHKQFLAMVQYARRYQIFISTSTNGHFITDKIAKATVLSGLNKIIISLDGTTQEVYEIYRKEGKLAKVLLGTHHLIKWKRTLRKKTPKVIWQFLITKYNEHQVQEVQEIAKAMGVDKLTLKTAQIYDIENNGDWIPENQKYARYAKNRQGNWIIKNKLENQCWRMWHSCVITWDGRVIPCCFDKDAKYALGNLRNTPLPKIWKSRSYHNFRNRILRSRKSIDICTNCTEGGQIWA